MDIFGYGTISHRHTFLAVVRRIFPLRLGAMHGFAWTGNLVVEGLLRVFAFAFHLAVLLFVLLAARYG